MAQDPNVAPTIEFLTPDAAEAYLLSVSAVLASERDPIAIEGIEVHKHGLIEGHHEGHAYKRWDTEVSVNAPDGSQFTFSETEVVQDWDDAKTVKLSISKLGSPTAHQIRRPKPPLEYLVTGLPRHEIAEKGTGAELFATLTTDFQVALDEKLSSRRDLRTSIDKATQRRLAEQAPAQKSRLRKALGRLSLRKH